MMKTKPFNLEAAKAGAKVVTRDGRPVRIICWDAKGIQPIVAIVDEEIRERARQYDENGYLFSGMELDSCLDLLLVDETHELTEFEQAVLDNVFTVSCDTTVYASKILAKKLLSIARKEILAEMEAKGKSIEIKYLDVDK